MGKTVFLLAAVLLATIIATPAFAQGAEVALPDGSSPPRDDGSLYRGAYEVTEEGALIYGGDVEYRCEDLVAFGAPAEPEDEDATAGGSVLEPLTKEAVELCAKAGFPPEGATLGASVSSSAAATASAPGAEKTETLPGTGGPPYASLLLGAAVPAAAAALLASRVRRRA